MAWRRFKEGVTLGHLLEKEPSVADLAEFLTEYSRFFVAPDVYRVNTALETLATPTATNALNRMNQDFIAWCDKQGLLESEESVFKQKVGGVVVERRPWDALAVQLVSRDGRCIEGGLICEISPRGLCCFASVNPDLGLPLDEKGRVKLVEEE